MRYFLPQERTNTVAWALIAFDSLASDERRAMLIERARMFPQDVILKRFEEPDEVRDVPKGRFETVRIGGLVIGRASYEPGWKWSEHVGPQLGASRCTVEHVGLVLTGAATVAFEDGRVLEMRAGELFYIPAVPHDSWVIGDQPYVSLHFLGAGEYMK